jgi:CheY-like chemotaxis protein/anti-sigma regulatory factor (Ser/Thr protein kinase)
MNSILVVEDAPNERVGLCRLLERSGFAVRAAADGAEALRHIEQEKFDLLLVDVWMPGMNGLEMLSHLPKDYRPKILVVTGDDTAQTLLGALREDAYQLIAKPFDPKQLVQLIKNALASPRAADKVQVLSADPHFVELRLPCDRQTAGRIQDFLRQLESDLPAEVRRSVELAFHELLMNAIEWGGRLNPDAKVQITFLRTEKLLLYRIADPGPGFDPAKLDHAAIGHPPEDPVAHTDVRVEKGIRPGGFGILMAQSLVDELVYNEAHNEVVLLKYLREPATSPHSSPAGPGSSENAGTPKT